MAAAEARSAWQRTVNRCFVQEDAKRAPKLACCPSSSSLKLQPDPCQRDPGNEPDHSYPNFMPLNWNLTNSNLPPDTKWWLQLQPNFGNQRDFMHEELSVLESELNGVGNGDLNPSKLSEEPITGEDNKDSYLASGLQWRFSATCMRHDPGRIVQELKVVKTLQPVKHTKNASENLKADFDEYWYHDDELMDWKSVDQLISDRLEKVSSDSASPWVGREKTGPWWRTADKDELASLVAQKSLEPIENCDLPRPQKMHVQRGTFTSFECFDHEGIFSASLNRDSGICDLIEHAHYPDCGNVSGMESPSSSVHYLIHYSEKLSSSTNTTNKTPSQSKHHSKGDSSKAQLLEALCHSQTHAREAEKAARQAYSEKEHIIKLLFRQASHLFSYKQWLQLLQFETIYLQLKSKDHQLSTLFPVLPWMPSKERHLRKHKRRKCGSHKDEISKFALAVAVGLGLASVGLFLGWTMGWCYLHSRSLTSDPLRSPC